MIPDTSCDDEMDPTASNLSFLFLNTSESDGNETYPCHNTSAPSRGIPVMPLYITVTSTLFYVIIFLTGTIGNSIVAAVVGLHHEMRSSTNLFLVNLALADLMVILVCMPTALVEIYAKDQWYFGSIMCSLVPMLENSVAHASVLTMLVIALERFKAICHPLKLRGGRFYSKTMKLIVILFIWLIALLSSMPFLGISIYRDSKYHDQTKIKVCRQSITMPWQRVYIVGLFVVFFALPFIVLAILYIVIAKALVQEFKYSDKMMDQACRNKNKARRRVVIMLIIITCLFFFFHLPFRTVSLWMILTDPRNIKGLGFEGFWNLLCFARIMFYLNSCTNPIIYNVVSTKFRRAFSRICIGKRYTSSRENTFSTGGTHVTLKLMHR